MKYIRRFFIGLMALLLLSGAIVYVLITFYKKELANLLRENLKVNYGLDLKVQDVTVTFFDNWPHASVKLKNVYLANTINPSKSGPLLKAESISLSFNMQRMMHKEFIVKYISINGADINLVRNADGTKNFQFKKQAHDTVKHKGIIFEINKIAIENVNFKFINNERKQNVAMRFVDVAIRLKQYSDGFKAGITGQTLVEELLFNEKNGAFLKNTRTILDLQLNYLNETNAICIYSPSKVEIEGHDYLITSLIKLGESRKLALRIESTKIKVERVVAILTPKMRQVLSNFEVKRPIDAKILIVANLGEKEDPVIIADIIGNNCDLAIGNSKIPYSGLNFRGTIRSLDSTGQRGDIDRASVVFSPITGRVYDFPFTATVQVNNLSNPDICIEAGLLIEPNKIPYQLSKDFILKGTATANVKYKGPTNQLNKSDFLKSPMELSATVTFNNLSYKELNRPYTYRVNGKATINNKDIQFDNLFVKTDMADARVKGKAEGFVPYVFGFAKGFKTTVSASTDLLDLNPLFLNSETISETPSSSSSGDKLKKVDQSKFEFDIKLFANRLSVRKVEASNAKVEMTYKGNSLDIKSASINTCDGKLMIKGLVEDFSKVNVEVKIQDVDVKKLFDQFENFGQDAIVSSNLKGIMSVDAKFKTTLDAKMNLKPESMVCDAKLKLVNGHLINYEPVQSLSNFLFKNRDFNDIAFSELNERFKLRGYEMQIDELEIGSNVLNLYVVDGLYHFKGNSNINILIPWSNLKKRGKNYIPKSSGESAESTKGVKLNFNGPSKKMKISFGHKEQTKIFS